MFLVFYTVSSFTRRGVRPISINFAWPTRYPFPSHSSQQKNKLKKKKKKRHFHSWRKRFLSYHVQLVNSFTHFVILCKFCPKARRRRRRPRKWEETTASCNSKLFSLPTWKRHPSQPLPAQSHKPGPFFRCCRKHKTEQKIFTKLLLHTQKMKLSEQKKRR